MLDAWKQSPEGKAWRDAAHPLNEYAKGYLISQGWMTPNEAATMMADHNLTVKDAKESTVADYFASLPPGDEGLVEAYIAAYDITDIRCREREIGFFHAAPGTKESIAVAIAAVLDLHRKRVRTSNERVYDTIMRWAVGQGLDRTKAEVVAAAALDTLDANGQTTGWLDPDKADQLKKQGVAEHYASLPPGDEGLEEARVKAVRAWVDAGGNYTIACLRGIAAVLDLHRRRGGDYAATMYAEGWLPPDKAEAMRESAAATNEMMAGKVNERDTWICDLLCAVVPDYGLRSETIPRLLHYVAEEVVSLRAENAELRAENLDLKTRWPKVNEARDYTTEANELLAAKDREIDEWHDCARQARG